MNSVQIKPACHDDAARLGLMQGYEDDFELDHGISLAKTFSKDAHYRMSRDFPKSKALVDVLQAVGSDLVVNARVRKLLEDRKVPGLEFFEVRILNHKGVAVKEQYFVINLLHLVDCVDRKKTRYTPNSLNKEKMVDVSNLTIIESKIDKELQLFRVRGLPMLTVVTRELAAALKKAKVVGLDFPELASFTF